MCSTANPSCSRARAAIAARRRPSFRSHFMVTPPWLSVFHPLGAVLVELLLEDGHLRLERVDQPVAGVQRWGAVRRRDHDHHADIPNQQPSQPMLHPDVGYLPAPQGLCHQLGDLRLSHWLMGLILEPTDSLPTVVVTDHTDEGRDRSIAGTSDVLDKGGGVDDVPSEQRTV